MSIASEKRRFEAVFVASSFEACNKITFVRLCLFFLITVIFVFCCSKAYCQASRDSELNNFGLQVTAPEGAVVPKGMDLIKFGMTRNEVHMVLNQYHDLIEDHFYPYHGELMTSFPYVSGGKVYFGHVIYDEHRKVIGVDYGFQGLE